MKELNQEYLSVMNLIPLSEIEQKETDGGVVWYVVVAAVLGGASAITGLYDFGYNYAKRHLH
jgi:hypothetical protein